MRGLVDSARRVLAFGAHPDDVEVGAGGLLARLAQHAEVTLVVASIPNRHEQRRAEAREGAARLGVRLELLVEDRASRVDEAPMHELVGRFDALVATHAPDLVITHAADDLHWDHVVVHRATVSALRRTRCDILAFHATPDLGATRRTVGPVFADITSTIETKLHSIAAHASQFPSPDAVEGRRDHARATGRLCGTTYAESFELLRLYV